MLVLENLPPERRRAVSFSEDTIIDHAIKSENVDELTGIFARQSSLSPNSMTLQGESPLHVSVRKDRLNSTKVLIEQGADVNVQDDEGQTALHYSIGNDNVDMTSVLLEAGADLFRHDDKGILPTALVKSTIMKSFINDKIFDATIANLHRVLNNTEVTEAVTNRLGSRHFSDTDLMMCGSDKRRPRYRSFSDSGLRSACSHPRSILKKNSSFEPRVSLISETQESLESVYSNNTETNNQKEENKRRKISDEVLASQYTEKEVHTYKPSAKRSNFLFRALWRTRHKLNFLIKR